MGPTLIQDRKRIADHERKKPKYKHRKNKNADKTADEITADNENDDIDTIDFESLTNDTPREYVSISINTHKEKE